MSEFCLETEEKKSKHFEVVVVGDDDDDVTGKELQSSHRDRLVSQSCGWERDTYPRNMVAGIQNQQQRCCLPSMPVPRLSTASLYNTQLHACISA